MLIPDFDPAQGTDSSVETTNDATAAAASSQIAILDVGYVPWLDVWAGTRPVR